MLVGNVRQIMESLDDGRSGTDKLNSHLYNGYSARDILDKSKYIPTEDLRTLMPKLVEFAMSNSVGEGYQTGHSQFGVGGKGIDININLTSDQQKILDKYFTIKDLTGRYGYDDYGNWVTCEGSIPHAIIAFLESTDFVDAIKNAVSIGGDSDTIGAMAGSIAEAYYGVSQELEEKALEYLTPDLSGIYYAFETIKKIKE